MNELDLGLNQYRKVMLRIPFSFHDCITTYRYYTESTAVYADSSAVPEIW